MPQTRASDSEGWISSDQLVIPPQKLSVEEVDGFLKYLFSDIARQPEKLLLRETAGVVRYLRCLAVAGVPSHVVRKGTSAVQDYWRSEEGLASRNLRNQADCLARRIWSILLQCGEIKPARKASATDFLKRHRGSYLSPLNPYLKGVDVLVRDFDLPPDFKDPFRPPNMMAEHLSKSGEGNPRLQDDLTERIYAAYWGLKRAKAKQIKPRIANELNRRKVKFKGPRRRKNLKWDHDHVHERIKNQQKQWLAEFRGSKAEARKALGERADALADCWIHRFRFGLMVDVQSPGESEGTLPGGQAVSTDSGSGRT